jgi:hypothetical protein
LLTGHSIPSVNENKPSDVRPSLLFRLFLVFVFFFGPPFVFVGMCGCVLPRRCTSEHQFFFRLFTTNIFKRIQKGNSISPGIPLWRRAVTSWGRFWGDPQRFYRIFQWHLLSVMLRPF